MAVRRTARTRTALGTAAAAVLAAITMAGPAAAASSVPAARTTTAASHTAPRPGGPPSGRIGQRVRHVTPATFPGQFTKRASAAALPAGNRSSCPVPSRPGLVQCMSISRAFPASGTEAGITADTKAGTQAAAVVAGYSPAQLQSAYGLTTASATGGTSGGAAEAVAIVGAYDDPNAAADLAAYRTQFGMPPCLTATGAGCLVKVNENNQAGPLPSAPPSTAGDWTWDESASIDMVTAICPNCEIMLFEANSTSVADLGQAVLAARNDADFITAGWSSPEFFGETADDQLYFNAPGKALVFPAGDSGYGTAWPAVSQDVTSVGGTTLTANTGTSRGWDETAWAGTGAGCATAEPKPAWQTADDTSPNGCLNRSQNDVAAVANPSDGVAVYDSTAYTGATARSAGWGTGGGTTVSAAIIASVYALNGYPQPGTRPASYPYQPASSGDFNAVTSGTDGTCESNRAYLCNAQSGYNGPAGAGTPDGAAGLAFSASADAVTLTDPGTQDINTYTGLTIPAQATDSASGQTLSYSATGLPNGFAVNPGTGTITGTTAGATGTWPVTLTATDSTGAAGSVRFNIVIMTGMTNLYSPQSGPVTLNLGGKCLDDTASNTIKIEEWACNGGTNQNWTFQPSTTPGAPGTITYSPSTSECIQATGTSPGSLIQLASCTTSLDQKWSIRSGGQLFNPLSGRCLADPGDSTTNGTQLTLQNCDPADTGQQWTMPPSAAQLGLWGKCMDDSGSTANNAPVQIKTCGGTASQQWTAKPDDTFRISGVCLDMQGQSTLDGGLAEMYACNGGANQQWIIGPQGQIENTHSGKCLDDPGDNGSDGTQLVQNDCYGQAGETWTVT